MATEDESSPEFKLEGIEDVQDFVLVRIRVFAIPKLLQF